jgi:hypothetical protein
MKAAASNALPPDAPAMLKLVQTLSRTIEQLLLGGLTAASRATQEHLAVSMKEAARMRLLRLGSTIRVVGEEINRFDADPKRFSPQRLSFFLNRTWILCHGITAAIESKDVGALSRLLATPPTVAVKELKLALIGVVKRVAPNVFNAFEFRMIALDDASPITRGQQVVWSAVFPAKKGVDLPAEAFLQLPQKQGFRPSAMLAKKVIRVTDATASIDTAGVARMSLGESSKLETLADDMTNWTRLVTWDRAAAAKRVGEATASPMDLDVEMQELVALPEWSLNVPTQKSDDAPSVDWPLTAHGLHFTVRTDPGAAGEAPRDALKKAAKVKADRPTLLGLMHYESCRFVLLPLTLIGPDGPVYITLTHAQISSAELVKALQIK